MPLILRILFAAALLAVLVAVLGGPAVAQSSDALKTVTAIGSGAVRGSDVAGAKQRAIENGLVAALHAVTAELMPPESRIQHFQALEEQLFSQTEQFIQGFRVLTEASSADHYRVLLEATVVVPSLKTRLDALGVSLTREALPAVLFLLAETRGVDSPPHYWWGADYRVARAAAEAPMSAALQAAGFPVLDRNEMLSYLDADDEVHHAELSDVEAIRLGNRFGAGLVVVGTAAAAATANTMGDSTQSFRGSVGVRALRTATGERVAEVHQQAVKMGADAAAGQQSALQAAGQAAGQELAERLAGLWRARPQQSGTVEIALVGTRELGNYIALRRAISELPGMVALRVTARGADTATLQADYPPGSQALADALMVSTFDNFGINVRHVSDGRLTVDLISH